MRASTCSRVAPSPKVTASDGAVGVSSAFFVVVTTGVPDWRALAAAIRASMLSMGMVVLLLVGFEAGRHVDSGLRAVLEHQDDLITDELIGDALAPTLRRTEDLRGLNGLADHFGPVLGLHLGRW